MLRAPRLSEQSQSGALRIRTMISLLYVAAPAAGIQLFGVDPVAREP